MSARIYFYDSYSTITDILLRVRGGHEVEPYPQHPPAAEAAYNCGPRRRAPRRRDTDGDHGAGDAASSFGADGAFLSKFDTIVPTSPSTCF